MRRGTTMRALLILAVLLPLAEASSKCTSIWIFRVPCLEPASVLLAQVKAWSGKKCRDQQETCMYELTKESPNYFEVKHTSPQTHKVTDIHFTLSPPSAPAFCKVKATATSQDGSHPNDYCLIYNLMEGSGLTQSKDCREVTNDAMCPVRQSGNCRN